MVVYGFRCFQIVLGGFRWFSDIGSFSSYGKIPCFKFKRSKQWEDFAVPRKNDVKVPLKQETKFFGNSKYKFSLKNTLVGSERFFPILTYIAYIYYTNFDSPFAHFWARISSFSLLLVARSVF